MKWKTKISKFTKEKEIVRGYNLMGLIGKTTFSEMVFLLLRGDLPTKNETKLMDALFIATCEHSLNPPSTINARVTASSTGNISAALAAGILAIGKNHGGAVQGCAKILQERLKEEASNIVKDSISKGEKIPGYGHKFYSVDPRTQKLLQVAKELNINGKYIKLVLELERELEKAKGKKLCLNIDGIIAAIILELKFDWKVANTFFILPRVLGLAAHIKEEITEEKPYRRLSNEEIEYIKI